MSSVKDEKNSERARIFETIFSSPGLSETCKIVLNPSRQTVLLLSRMIEQGIESRAEEGSDELLAFLPDESVAELKAMVDDMLRKSGLVEFYGRIKTI